MITMIPQMIPLALVLTIDFLFFFFCTCLQVHTDLRLLLNSVQKQIFHRERMWSEFNVLLRLRLHLKPNVPNPRPTHRFMTPSRTIPQLVRCVTVSK